MKLLKLFSLLKICETFPMKRAKRMIPVCVSWSLVIPHSQNNGTKEMVGDFLDFSAHPKLIFFSNVSTYSDGAYFKMKDNKKNAQIMGYR